MQPRTPPATRSRPALARILAAGVGLALPLVGMALGSRALADWAGASAGAALAALPLGSPALPPSTHEMTSPDAYEAPAEAPVASGAKPAPLPAKAPKGVLVRAEVVARAAQRGVIPGGAPVPASGKRPAGLRLSGVGGYGLRDGDVITQVGGTPATSLKAVIGAVTGALKAHAAAISGVAWRGDESFPVTVEIPWPKEEENEPAPPVSPGATEPRAHAAPSR